MILTGEKLEITIAAVIFQILTWSAVTASNFSFYWYHSLIFVRIDITFLSISRILLTFFFLLGDKMNNLLFTMYQE